MMFLQTGIGVRPSLASAACLLALLCANSAAAQDALPPALPAAAIGAVDPQGQRTVDVPAAGSSNSATGTSARPAPSPVTRIEQVRKNGRVVEVIVTPANTGYSYTMINRDAQRPTPLFGQGAGLSTPQFLHFDIR